MLSIRRLVAVVFNGVRSMCIQLSSRDAVLQRWPLRVKGMNSIVLFSCTKRHCYCHHCGWLLLHTYCMKQMVAIIPSILLRLAMTNTQKMKCITECRNGDTALKILSLCPWGKREITTLWLPNRKNKKRGGGENRGSSSALYYGAVHSRTSLHGAALNLSHSHSTPPSPPSIQLHLLGWREEYAFMSSRHPPR